MIGFVVRVLRGHAGVDHYVYLFGEMESPRHYLQWLRRALLGQNARCCVLYRHGGAHRAWVDGEKPPAYRAIARALTQAVHGAVTAALIDGLPPREFLFFGLRAAAPDRTVRFEPPPPLLPPLRSADYREMRDALGRFLEE